MGWCPRPTPGQWHHPGASLNLKVLVDTVDITASLPPRAVVKLKRAWVLGKCTVQCPAHLAEGLTER